MSMETKHGPGQPAAPNGSHEGYERSDADPRGLLHSGAWLIAVLVVVFFSMAWLFDFYGKVQSLGKPASPFERCARAAARAAPASGTARRAARLLRAAGQTSEYLWLGGRAQRRRAHPGGSRHGIDTAARSARARCGRYSRRASAIRRALRPMLPTRTRPGHAASCWSAIRIMK